MARPDADDPMSTAQSSREFIDQMREWQRQIDAMPPRVARFIATHSVPYGRVYRMWTTRGELIAYVNRGEIADYPSLKVNSAPLCALLPPSLTGIPVVVE